ncbi:hypothetical protein QJV15_07725 [Listeria cossartiae subsp. cayugensis]|uniref:hypothetical protein n=1 Tax=Listeria cossartiae TaxID=2838249 RepID=UPI0028806F58|nr:hypothetical protein [Listeria cossartiae]MDT0000749.1 hypothetical protein [Listeria cossartiae subsp. cayugensis]MDT0009147.1 hypothetical protein [Listeria cossartiae subsp. cayugensis]MDT0030979.1 hypothetical protein [Listeria cossartiae subsp. cayugensis]MDT0039094.1 hypothetical protein [Listeria cossartiae subsp. cayugensis]MDT0044246.1 hypothetical protein [Listeria cossartiae subsp. cayugensis]
MADKIIVHPNELQVEVDSFLSTTKEVGDVSNEKLKNLKEETILATIDDLQDIVDKFTKCIESYYKLSIKDANEIETLKEAWIEGDKELSKNFE